uniref:Uncharacterized protein n=1 Tax=Arundo donax TaxID=35708 RepID=A0A0A9TPV9_ARUDO
MFFWVFVYVKLVYDVMDSQSHSTTLVHSNDIAYFKSI